MMMTWNRSVRLSPVLSRAIPPIVQLVLVLVFGLSATPALADGGFEGYYRYPTIHGDTVVFTAEGDLWRVGVEGGVAERLTSHPGLENHPAISPDGEWVAFSARYEGAAELYLMPLAGGLPRRLTWQGEGAAAVGWTPAGEVLYYTGFYTTLPTVQLVAVDPETLQRRVLPLWQASSGVYDPAGGALFFARQPFQGSHTRGYKGGTAEQLWRFDGSGEAVPLTADYPGTSRDPMWWQGRVYFASDRDGTMNVWSMAPDGSDLAQHTSHVGWEVRRPALHGGRIVYQLGADLRLLDLADGSDRKLAVTLASDLDQRRERWIDEPFDYLTAAHLSPDGERVVLTARGEVFVAPVKQGRLVAAGRASGVRYRSARFLPPEGDRLVALSDASGEVEVWRLDARGVATPEQLTEDSTTLRFDALPSPDGEQVAWIDRQQELWVHHVADGSSKKIASFIYFGGGDLAWSPDGRWLAYTAPAESFLRRIHLYDSHGGTTLALTSDRFDSYSPAWSPDGAWIYFLSDRNLVSLVSSPWGNYMPQPFFDRPTKIFQVALRPGLRSPFAPATELDPADDEDAGKKAGGGQGDRDSSGGDASGGEEGGGGEGGGGEGGAEKTEPPEVTIVADGLAERLHELPVPPGNYADLAATAERLYWVAIANEPERPRTLMTLPIERHQPKVSMVAEKIEGYELSLDRKQLLLRQGKALFVVPAAAKAPDKLAEHQVPLNGWSFPLDPVEEWRQLFVDSWRLLRDYFYDPGMHGVDWLAMKEKYLPLVDRVTDRHELSEIMAQLTAELSALHHFVRGGDQREGEDDVQPASLGARLERDEAAGGWRVVEIYRADPDLPDQLAPLARPGVEVAPGAVITAINGVATLSVPDPGVLLRGQAGKQVLLAVHDAGEGDPREVIVEPIAPHRFGDLRYDHWELTRRERVEEAGGGEIGYVHLRAMGNRNYTEWAQGYFPVMNRKGLIIDVRHNRGGNIDSWLLGTLMRRPWMWWQARVGVPYPNLQAAFNGPMVVLVDQRTASDGEAFAEGFRRLGLGKVIGTRTWGGEIWLTSSNVLVDRGIATAAEFGVYGPEGEWLIEGWGVEPDIVVDNLPHATFNGGDAQLEAAIEHLKKRIAEEKPAVPEPPPYPDKSTPDNRGGG